MDVKENRIKDKILMRTYQASANTSIFAMSIVAVIEIMMLLMTLINQPLYGDYLWRYRGFYLALLIVVLTYIVITLYVKQAFEKRYKLLNYVNPIAAVFFFAWAVGTSYNDYMVLGTVDPTVFMTFSLSIPLCFYLDPTFYGIMAIIADISMISIALHTPNGIGLVINMVIYCTFQLALGLSLLYVKSNLAGKIIKTEEQRDEIEKLSAAQTVFFSSVSHEIRTPINAVLGMDDMILRESREDRTLEYAQNIKTAGTTLLNLINDILDFSKIGAGKMVILPAKYESARLFHDLVVMTEGRAREKGLSLITNVDENIPAFLFGDELRIKQVVTNILTNAVKYTDEGSVTLEAHCEKADEENIDLYLSVKDTGIGIRKEDIQKLFAAFERIDEEKNRNVEGTGLGISIASDLLHMMGSKLQVSSEYGKGSDFFFVLRQKVVSWEPMGDFEAKWKESVHKRQKAEASLSLPQAKVLVADDDRMNLKVINKLLGLFGITPVLVESGYEAIETIKKSSFDFVFLDHKMPEMDGLETLKIIRNDKLVPESTRVIALTATAGEHVEEVYLAAGFDDYLSKPVEVGSLETVFKKWME